jgi:hypothetical protein
MGTLFSNDRVLCGSFRLWIVVWLLAPAVLVGATTNDVKINSPAQDVAKPQSAIKDPPDSADLRIGNGDWVVHGAVADSFRRRPSTEERSLGKRLLSLPIVRLFVPKAAPPSSETEVYFVDGESSRPWAAIASGARRSHGSPDNPLFLEGGCALVSVGR